MIVLSVNAGSSSLKFQAYDMPEENVLISGVFERIGMKESFYTIKVNGEKIKKEVELKNHESALEILMEELIDNKIVSSLDEIKAIGHRIAQGGPYFDKTEEMTEENIKKVRELAVLAPLHNAAAIKGIKAAKSVVPNALQTGTFDTAFHQTIEEENYLYPVPYEWCDKYKVRKYGFHGTSHKFITKTMKEILKKDDVNLIICHIGSGGSLCAVKDGKSFDTTMGFTPNAGIMMGTRSGDIDYSVIPYIMKNANMTLEEVDNTLNKKSGLLGIGGSSDCRDVEDAIAVGNKEAKLAYDMYVERIASYVATYYMKLEGKIDALVLTAGVGENGSGFRKDLVEKLSCFGIKLNDEVNNTIASFKSVHSGIITTNDSKFPVYVVPTDEELMIATDTYNIINK
ncbi:MAG: acetate kinase [Erysipelotrichaceae bacterium]|nr:acetate kinase [Erysipelotrichaceae bacterium]